MAMLRDSTYCWEKVSRFVREARITAALEHPNIVPIYDIGVAGSGQPYFTMKLLGGETLFSILKRVHAGYGDYRKRYPLTSLLRIFQGICNAIGFAHSRGVIHLDLKPANIQVGSFGEVLVFDWGIAKVIDKDPILFPDRLILEKDLRDIQAGAVVCGTPGFMSPEQSLGRYDDLDESTDVFALGAILSAILKSRKFPSGSRKRERGQSAKVPAALEAVAAKAMSNRPEDRYQGVEELSNEVQAYLDGFPTRAQQAGTLTHLWLLIKRHHVVAGMVAAIFGILVAALINIHHSAQVAQAALEKMKEEQESKHQISRLAATQVMIKANQQLNVLNFEGAISSLQQVLSLNEGNLDACSKLSSVYLGNGDPEESWTAWQCFLKVGSITPDGSLLSIEGITEKYAKLASIEGRDVLYKHQDDFIAEIFHASRSPWDYRDLVLTAFFAKSNRNPQTIDFGRIEKGLRILNPDETNLVFNHEDSPAGLKITIHGVSEIQPLAGLPISFLDASNCGMIDLKLLALAPLISLDLSNTATTSLGDLSPISTLQELRLTGWKSKNYTELRSLPQLRQVTVDAPDVSKARDAVRAEDGPPQITGG
jgi:serine/threonine protein kinase